MTLKVRIIPCLDIKDGRVVKGKNFIDLVDAGDPIKIANIYNKSGADEICFLDITASLENRKIMLDILTRTAESCFIPLTVGGGIKTLEDIRNLLLSGADKIVMNTNAVLFPDIISKAAEKFGNQCIVVALDVKTQINSNNNKFWEIFIYGGKKSTGIDAINFTKKIVKMGAGEIILTSIDQDGTKKGYNIELTKAISDSINVPVIASGGVGNLQHLVDGIKDGHASAVLAASIFHFGKYSIYNAKEYMLKSGIPVRLDRNI